jgi:hypothetical protein
LLSIANESVAPIAGSIVSEDLDLPVLFVYFAAIPAEFGQEAAGGVEIR